MSEFDQAVARGRSEHRYDRGEWGLFSCRCFLPFLVIGNYTWLRYDGTVLYVMRIKVYHGNNTEFTLKVHGRIEQDEVVEAFDPISKTAASFIL